MFHKSAAIVFIDKTCIVQTSRVFTDSLHIPLQLLNNPLKGNLMTLRYQKKYLNPVMIGHALHMPLHLFRCFYIRHILTL